jgi:phage terminase large subunit-like protein
MAAGTDTGHARDYVAVAEKWARDVVAKRIVACELVRLTCRRHLEDLKRAKRDKAWGYHFDSWHGNDVCDFVEKLPHVKGRWDPKTIVLAPPQVFILVCLFGWRRNVDGLRRYTSAYIEMARKGAKSTLAAGIGLYCLTCEQEEGPEIYVGATTGAQALKVFEPMQGMARKTPDLREAFGLTVWAKSITCADNNGFIQTVNAKGSTNDGHNPHCAILDELHAHKDRALYDVMQSADGARENPLLLAITTAGFNMAGVCYEQRLYIEKILRGILIADHYFGIIFTLDEGDDPYDESVWAKANPLMPATPKLAKMRAYAADAKSSPASEGNFKTKNLNLWLGAASAWLNMAQWKRCATGVTWEDFDGLDVFLGGDLADKDDITALVLAAFRPSPLKEGVEQLIFKPMFYLPSAVLQDAEQAEGRGAAPYRAWHKQGVIELTDGDWVDHNTIERQIRAWHQRYPSMRRGTFDQFAAAQAMASRLNEDLSGDPEDPIFRILHKKAAAVTDPAKELERRVKAGPAYLAHDGNACMDWMASNVVVARRRDETLLPIKESPMSKMKIDGIDALINAIHPAVTEIADDTTSFWDR